MEKSIKKAIIPALLVIGILLSPLNALAGTYLGSTATGSVDSYTESTLFVSGTGHATVKPNKVTLNLGIDSRGKTVAETNKQIETYMDKLADAFSKFGVERSDIKSTYWSWYPNLNYDENGKTSIMDFSGQRTLEINFSDNSAAAEEAISYVPTDDKVSITSANVNYVATGDNTEGYAKARTNALEVVKQKAVDLAQALGVTLGRLLRVEDSTTPYEVWGTNAEEANIDYYISATYAFN